jgi:hypothetical protein
VICGHLAPDLVALADELLLEPEGLSVHAASEQDSGEEIFGDPGQAQEILDVFI